MDKVEVIMELNARGLRQVSPKIWVSPHGFTRMRIKDDSLVAECLVEEVWVETRREPIRKLGSVFEPPLIFTRPELEQLSTSNVGLAEKIKQVLARSGGLTNKEIWNYLIILGFSRTGSTWTRGRGRFKLAYEVEFEIWKDETWQPLEQLLHKNTTYELIKRLADSIPPGQVPPSTVTEPLSAPDEELDL